MRLARTARRSALGAILLGGIAACGATPTHPTPIDPVPSPPSPEVMVDAPGNDAFAYPFPVLSSRERRAFAVGNSFFRNNWIAAPASAVGRDGLGPLFNARSCSACHIRDGRGQPPVDEGDGITGFLLRVGIADAAGSLTPHPRVGGQLQPFGVAPAVGEGRVTMIRRSRQGVFGDGVPFELERLVFSVEGVPRGTRGARLALGPRVAPHLIGMGLLEAIPADAITIRADPEDADEDGISGRGNRVIDVRTGSLVLGRFGWKAGQPTVEQQVARALQQDIGITSSLFPHEPLTPAQRETVEFVSGGEPEIDDRKLGRLVFYARTLAVPSQRGRDDTLVSTGRALFGTLGCADCHTPRFRAGPVAGVEDLEGATIEPFTDLLLHDMGPDLADDLGEGTASGSEWRTPPLWGIGLVPVVSGHTRYLHDGRARNLTEAILWHGGEAERSRERFRLAPRPDRDALLAFLASL